MNNWIEMVQEFMEASNSSISDEPKSLTVREWQLRHNLLKEEYEEYKFAGDVVEVLDAFADMIYIIIGTCLKMGLDIDKVFKEVHKTNMAKFSDGIIEKNGKIQKPSNWQPPNIAAVLDIDPKMRTIDRI